MGFQYPSNEDEQNKCESVSSNLILPYNCTGQGVDSQSVIVSMCNCNKLITYDLYL